jgi:alpha-L-rhamnosidase
MFRSISNFYLPSRRDFLAAAAALTAAPAFTQASLPLEAQFRDVPNAARMRMHWYIFGPAWTPEEGERQLKLMADAHIGGVLIFPAYPIALDNAAEGIQNLPYLSPEFLSVLRSIAASSKRAGLTLDMVLGTGWPYGGPSVSLEQSAHSLRISKVAGSPGGAWSLPALREGEAVLGAFSRGPAGWRQVQPGDPAAESGEVVVFRSAPTRMEVKRASLGAEGWVVDHYDATSLDQFLRDVGSKLIGAIPKGEIRSIFCDSLEVYRATWTAKLPEAFARRRGYQLMAELPALFDAGDPNSRDIRCDFWRTLAEQTEEQFIRPLTDWAHANGVTSQIEAYGTPPVSIRAYRHVDIPVGEHYEWKEFSSSRWASSGGHLAGKPVILAEAWTWLGYPNRFADTLEQLKLCSDLHFLSGINALYGVTYAYSPVKLGSPGWVPYFGPSTNHTSPYWPYFSHFADYVNRSTFVLQQGKPIADVALYLPMEDVMAEAGMEQLLPNWAVRDRLSSNGPPPEFSLKNALYYESDIVKTIITNGYAFDGVDTFTMNDGMSGDNGRLRLGDGDFGVLVLPNLTGIDPQSLDGIEAFVASGGTLIATKRLPERCWGLHERDRKTARVRKAIAHLFGNGPHREYRESAAGRGRVIFCPDERGSLLKALRSLPPDIAFEQPSEHVSFVHRRTPDRDFYFLANTSEQPQSLDGVFRVGHKEPALWDLKSGEVRPAVVFEHVAAGTRVPFLLGPLESKVIVFTGTGRSPQAVHTNLPLESDGARVFDNGTYFYDRGSGRKTVNVSGIPAPYAPAIHWRLALGDDRYDLDDLQSWTELPKSRFFSGQGVYEGEFDASQYAGLGVVLDLGAVRETAGVHLNGKSAGVAWMRPYRLDVTHLLRMGRNRLRVDVTNLLINKVLGQGPIDYSQIYAKYGNRFPAGDEWDVIREPLPAGLLGPVRLFFYKLVKI